MHSDVCGPMKNTSMDGEGYSITFIDDSSRKVWLYVLKSKGDCFEKFKVLVKTQSKHKIKIFRLDHYKRNNGF